MTTTNFSPANQGYILQAALSAYSDEMYTSVRRLNGTGIVSADGGIDTSTETFIGQKRWYKPTAAVVNTAGGVGAGANGVGTGAYSTFSSEQADYVKRVATYGHRQINVQEVVSMQDGLAKIARDFGEVRANDEHNAVINTLRGVANAESSNVAAESAGGAVTTNGITRFSQSGAAAANTGWISNTAGNNSIAAPSSDGNNTGTGQSGTGTLVGSAANLTGFFVDLNAGDTGGVFTGSSNTLVNALTATQQGAVRADALFKAVGMAFADYEPDYMYLVTSPEVLSELRGANLVDQTTVTEGNIEFQTIFGGKFRLVLTRTDQGDFAAGSTNAVNNASNKTSFLVKPGMISMNMLEVPMPVEIFRDANQYQGGGSTDVWYRWGYVSHAIGYSWNGGTTQFAEQGTGTSGLAGTNWRRRMDPLNLGILPIFHA